MNAETTIEKKYVTMQEAAEFTGLSVGTIRNLIATLELTGFRPVPGRIVLDLQELDRFVRRSIGKCSTRGRKVVGSKEPLPC